jgi:hypothetical protein
MTNFLSLARCPRVQAERRFVLDLSRMIVSGLCPSRGPVAPQTHGDRIPRREDRGQRIVDGGWWMENRG